MKETVLKYKKSIIILILIICLSLWAYPPKCWTGFCFESYGGRIAGEIQMPIHEDANIKERLDAMSYPSISKYRFYADELKQQFLIGSNFQELDRALKGAGADYTYIEKENKHQYRYTKFYLIAEITWSVSVYLDINSSKINEIEMSKMVQPLI